jgi:hypothetical protein
MNSKEYKQKKAMNYKEKAAEVEPKLKAAFPDGLTAEQVNAINEAIRAHSMKNNLCINYGVRILFPEAKWITKRVKRERDGKEFDIMECVEGIPAKLDRCDVCDCDPCQCDQYPSNEEETLREIPEYKEPLSCCLFVKIRKAYWFVEEIYKSKTNNHLLFKLVKEGSCGKMTAFVTTSELKENWAKGTKALYRTTKLI